MKQNDYKRPDHKTVDGVIHRMMVGASIVNGNAMAMVPLFPNSLRTSRKSQLSINLYAYVMTFVPHFLDLSVITSI